MKTRTTTAPAMGKAASVHARTGTQRRRSATESTATGTLTRPAIAKTDATTTPSPYPTTR